LKSAESARSHPAKWGRISGRTAVAPAYAASTWSQSFSFSQIVAIASHGSTDVTVVVPIVATTASRRQRRRPAFDDLVTTVSPRPSGG
jgi:hypothetical protein